MANGAPVLKTRWMQTFAHHQLQLIKGEGAVAFRLLTPKPRTVSVTVDSSKTHQTMLGWGGTGTPTAYRELSEEGRRLWWHWIAEYNLLLQREYPVGGELTPAMDNFDCLRDAKAHTYGANFPNGEVCDFAYNRAIQTLGGFVIFEFWDFPRWIGNSAEAYTKAMVKYCQLAKEKTGSAPFAVGIQNEIEMKADLVAPFVLELRKGLDANRFQEVKIHMSNVGWIGGGLKRLPLYRDNPAVWGKIDYSATNIYDLQGCFQNMDDADRLLKKWHDQTSDKPFLAIEYCANGDGIQNDGYLVAFSMGQCYHKLLTITDASLIAYCWTLLNVEQPSYAMTRSLFAIDRSNGYIPKPSSSQLRIYGAYSRRIHRGMVRREVACSDPDLMASAFKAPNGQSTLVLLNRGCSPAEVKWNWPESNPTTLELTDPYHQNQVLKNALASSRTVTVPAGGILTLSDVPLHCLPAGFQVP